VHLIAVAVVVTRFLAADSPILHWRFSAPLIKCGQNSLEVFCIGIVLSFCAHAAIESSLDSLWVQIFVGTAGVVIMTAVAYCWARIEGTVSHASFTGSNRSRRMTGSLVLLPLAVAVAAARISGALIALAALEPHD
jgi:hypothetical protein